MPDDPSQAVWPATAAGYDVLNRLGIQDYVPGETDDPKAVATLEAFMLAHHAGEPLMRHLFALLDAKRGAPDGSPRLQVLWLEMVGLQGGSEFRRRLRGVADIDAAELDKVVEFLFVPPELAAAIGGESCQFRPTGRGRGAPQEGLRVLSSMGSSTSRQYLDSGNGYNAAKHGLSTVTGYSELAFQPDPDSWEGSGPVPEGQVILEGPEILTVEYDGQGDQRRWFTVSRHVDPPGLIAHTLIAANLLDWLCEIERSRIQGGPAHVPVQAGPLPKDVIAGHYRTWGTLRLPLGALPLSDDARDETLRRLGLLNEQIEDPT